MAKREHQLADRQPWDEGAALLYEETKGGWDARVAVCEAQSLADTAIYRMLDSVKNEEPRHDR